jgi:hypothetical protein
MAGLALGSALGTNVAFLFKQRGAVLAPAVRGRHPLRSAVWEFVATGQGPRAEELDLAHALVAGSTQPTTATYCAAAATITSAWKISWKPNVRGHGSGRCRV